MQTHFHVGGIARLRMESCISQDDYLAVKLGNQGLKTCIVDIGGGTIPGTDQALLVQDETEFPTDNPPMITFAFPANLR